MTNALVILKWATVVFTMTTLLKYLY